MKSWTARVVDTTWGEVIAIYVVMFVLQVMANWFGIGLDSTDADGFHRSGVSVVTDHATGQEYLMSPHGSITPRLK